MTKKVSKRKRYPVNETNRKNSNMDEYQVNEARRKNPNMDEYPANEARRKNPNKKEYSVNETSRRLSKLRLTNSIDMPLLIIVILLLGTGLVMVLSASAPSSLADYGNSYNYVAKQAIATLIGLILMFFFSKYDYRKFKKSYKFIYVISVLVLVTVVIPGIGVSSGGARRWIKVGPVQLQPSELTKVGLIISLAGYFTDEKHNVNTFFKGVVVPIIVTLIPIILLYLIQNHMSAGIIMMMIAIVIIIMSGINMKYIATLIGMGVAGIFGFVAIKDKLNLGFRSDRMLAWKDPFAYSSTIGYQTSQGLIAIGSGGLFGVGLGKSTQKYLYIPEAHNDFIFAILAEELGFVGCAFVILLFILFTIRGIVISLKATDLFGSLMAIGITTLISSQAILNIAVVTNSIPNTGISLPFLSYGGTSLLILLSCVGILLNISKQSKHAS